MPWTCSGRSSSRTGIFSVTAPDDIKGYLGGYVAWENSVYTRLGDISARLVALGFSCEAELVREGLPHKELEKVRRMMAEYSLSGWDMAYILPADKALHDWMRRKEKK